MRLDGMAKWFDTFLIHASMNQKHSPRTVLCCVPRPLLLPFRHQLFCPECNTMPFVPSAARSAVYRGKRSLFGYVFSKTLLIP